MHQLTAPILSGTPLADAILHDLAQQIQASAISPPGLAIVQVGNDPASTIYINHKRKKCAQIGIESFLHQLPENTTTDELTKLITKLNSTVNIHGIIVQLPLPAHIDTNDAINQLDPQKDVDGLHALNIGYLNQKHPKIIPCTPKAILHMLEAIDLNLTGINATVIGRSQIVGRPIAQLLLNANATVTVCHSQTKPESFLQHTKNADLLIIATGKPNLITKNMVKSGAIIIDVGINRLESGKLVGDADFSELKTIAKWITPVPGGVGPLTIAMLLKNTWESYQQQRNSAQK